MLANDVRVPCQAAKYPVRPSVQFISFKCCFCRHSLRCFVRAIVVKWLLEVWFLSVWTTIVVCFSDSRTYLSSPVFVYTVKVIPFVLSLSHVYCFLLCISITHVLEDIEVQRTCSDSEGASSVLTVLFLQYKIGIIDHSYSDTPTYFYISGIELSCLLNGKIST